MKRVLLPIMVAMQIICWSQALHGAEPGDQSAYKITLYDLGPIQGILGSGVTAKTGNYQSLIISKSTTDILTSEHQKKIAPGDGKAGAPSVSSIALSAQFDATDHLAVQGAVGVIRDLWAPDIFDSMNGTSWEANLGVIYKVLDNLSYELHFGYMETGDLFTERSSYSDVESIIMVSNKISLSF